MLILDWIRQLIAQLSSPKPLDRGAPTAPPLPSQQPKEEPFDPIAFCDYVHDFGLAYRFRANVLISLCQTFSAASGQSFDQDAKLLKMLEACDKAMQRAVKSKKKETGHESADAFDKAIRALKDYAEEFHPDKPDVQNRIEDARKEDENNKYKRWDHSKDEEMIKVEFHICSTLPCQNPTKVRQMLSSTSVSEVLPEIIWNFCHYQDGKSVSLAQSPHLYTELPTSQEEYRPTFNHMQVQTLIKDRDSRYLCDRGDNGDNRDQNREPLITVHLLTNSSRRVFFVREFGKKEKPQAFDKIWTANNTLIFKGLHGELMGENSEPFERAINKHETTLWYQVKPSQGQTGPVGGARDWTELINKLKEFPDADIIISTTEPTIEQVP